MKKRLMIALCCLVLLVQLLPIVPMADAADVASVAEIPQDLYYCYAQLGDLPNGDALQFAYKNIVAGIDACATDIEISKDGHKLTLDEFKLALEAVRRDHTEQFWMATTYKYTPDEEGNILKMHPDYLMTGSKLSAAKVAFEQAIESMVGRLTPDMSEYEMEKTLHDALAVQVTYVTDAPNAHNAYGALVEGEAVCEGYAEALQCLLQRVGIQSIQVYGESINPDTGVGENHAWNMVRIDGKYYLTDPTWNDSQDTMLLYAYFNQTSAIFNEDHLQWRVGHDAKNNAELNCEVFDLPVCTATEANYFVLNELCLTNSNYSISMIGDLARKNNRHFLSVFIDPRAGTAQDFLDFVQANIKGIMGNLGLTRGEIIGPIGRQVLIVFETCSHDRPLKKVEATLPTCTTDGNIEYYFCIRCQRYYMDSAANEEILYKDSVKILSMGHDWSVRKTNNDTLCHKAEKCTEHDTYYLICSVCHEQSDTYTFQTNVTGEHAYAETWEQGDINNHKRVCANGCGIDITEAHNKDGENSACSVCGYKFSVTDLIPDLDGGEVANDVIDIILANPLILLGGGGSIVLVVVIVIIKKIREG